MLSLDCQGCQDPGSDSDNASNKRASILCCASVQIVLCVSCSGGTVSVTNDSAVG